MPTGQAIREAHDHRGLLRRGKTTALASGTDHVTDTTRFNRDTMNTASVGDFIRITSASNSDDGFVAKIRRIDPTTGKVYFSPTAGAAIVSGTTYEITRFGLEPDDFDRARDRALTRRTSVWWTRPLSVLVDVADWSVSAYSSAAGGEQDSAGVATTLDFPAEVFDRSMVITNSGANGNLASPSHYVQPLDQYSLYGRVSTRAQTAAVRVRDITQTADITLSGTSTFTFRGWQWFHVTFDIPDGCGEIQVWLGGASASCVSEWAGVGLVNENEQMFSLPRVNSPKDIGRVYELVLGGRSSTSTSRTVMARAVVSGVRRELAGDAPVLFFDDPVGNAPIYYQERTHYSALQSDYMAASDRTTGDAATTGCPLEYAEAAAAVELLEGIADEKEELKPKLVAALKDLTAAERRWGADPFVVVQRKNVGTGFVPVLRL